MLSAILTVLLQAAAGATLGKMGAALGAELPAVLVPGALHADELEADGALRERDLAVVLLAGDALHGGLGAV